jgi:hypothetical protein
MHVIRSCLYGVDIYKSTDATWEQIIRGNAEAFYETQAAVFPDRVEAVWQKDLEYCMKVQAERLAREVVDHFKEAASTSNASNNSRANSNSKFSHDFFLQRQHNDQVQPEGGSAKTSTSMFSWYKNRTLQSPPALNTAALKQPLLNPSQDLGDFQVAIRATENSELSNAFYEMVSAALQKLMAKPELKTLKIQVIPSADVTSVSSRLISDEIKQQEAKTLEKTIATNYAAHLARLRQGKWPKSEETDLNEQLKMRITTVKNSALSAAFAETLREAQKALIEAHTSQVV